MLLLSHSQQIGELLKLTSGESEFTIFCPKGGNGNGGLFLRAEASERVSLKETIVTAGFFGFMATSPGSIRGPNKLNRKWSALCWAKNWLSCWTTLQISGQVLVKYKRRPIIRLYLSTLTVCFFAFLVLLFLTFHYILVAWAIGRTWFKVLVEVIKLAGTRFIGCCRGVFFVQKYTLKVCVLFKI